MTENQLNLQILTPYIDALMQVSNLNINQAKTVVYYCIFTWCPNPPFKPLLNLDGETGTGKNKTMEQIKNWCYRPVWIKAENATPATFRDKLAGSGTAFIEEVDKVKEPKLECETWLKMRYDSTSASVEYRAQQVLDQRGNVNRMVRTNHFGYTVMHTQNPFQSIELDRRIIKIHIVKNTGREYALPRTDLGNQVLVTIARNIPWDTEVPGSGSAFDCWLPLIRVASYLEDNDFVNYAFQCIEEKTEETNLSKVFEPQGVVLSEIIPAYLNCLTLNKPGLPITTVTAAIRTRNVQFFPDERQVTQFAKRLGFEIYYPHNKAHIKVISREHLKSISDRQGIDTEVLTDG